MTWRLVGANNHELGRSPHVHSSLTACCAAVQRLRAEADRVTALVVMSPRTGTRAHTGTGTGSRTGAGNRTAVAPGTAAAAGTGAGARTWQLTLDEHCVAVAVRTFRRRRECRHSLQLFLSAAAEAQVASGVGHLHPAAARPAPAKRGRRAGAGRPRGRPAVITAPTTVVGAPDPADRGDAPRPLGKGGDPADRIFRGSARGGPAPWCSSS
ncbi:hypothetical protein AB0O22_38935 [Streptomyces sp. NPDC091204]|uniref:hypothetical protein n=1 Tax=Streptomyces sp. NPDC091204 TaxID=3155299 RepID=UPI00343B523A